MTLKVDHLCKVALQPYPIQWTVRQNSKMLYGRHIRWWGTWGSPGPLPAQWSTHCTDVRWRRPTCCQGEGHCRTRVPVCPHPTYALCVVLGGGACVCKWGIIHVVWLALWPHHNRTSPIHWSLTGKKSRAVTVKAMQDRFLLTTCSVIQNLFRLLTATSFPTVFL